MAHYVKEITVDVFVNASWAYYRETISLERTDTVFLIWHSHFIDVRIRFGKGDRRRYRIFLKDLWELVGEGHLVGFVQLGEDVIEFHLPTLSEVVLNVEARLMQAIDEHTSLQQRHASSQRLVAPAWEVAVCSDMLAEMLEFFPNIALDIYPNADQAIASLRQSFKMIIQELGQFVALGLTTLDPEVKQVEGRFLPPDIHPRATLETETTPALTSPTERPFSEVEIELDPANPRDLFYSTLGGYVGKRETRGFFNTRNYVAYLVKAVSGKRLVFIDCSKYGNACYVFKGVEQEEEWIAAAQRTKRQVLASRDNDLLVAVKRHSLLWQEAINRLLENYTGGSDG